MHLVSYKKENNKQSKPERRPIKGTILGSGGRMERAASPGNHSKALKRQQITLITDMQLNHRFVTANINFRWKQNRRKKQQKRKSQQSRPVQG